MQTRPNPYAALCCGDGIAFQLYGHKSVVPADSWSACYLTTDHVDELYVASRAVPKAAYGRVPTRGIPRIGPPHRRTPGTRSRPGRTFARARLSDPLPRRATDPAEP
ncbi:hypothetical protein ACFXAZ_08205 [Streptomyces sp. NPDC059477]|uniref:hypothetical protein n=1 Tax=Streptomyces sp. NPDC059477 TaxID=3346847 RepID=UPI0036ABA41A